MSVLFGCLILLLFAGGLLERRIKQGTTHLNMAKKNQINITSDDTSCYEI